MTWTYDADGNLNLSDLSMEERVQLIEAIGSHLQEINWAWVNQFSPERIELSTGTYIYEDMNETELAELESILSRYEDNQIWTAGPTTNEQMAKTIFAVEGLATQVYGSSIILGKHRGIWDGFDTNGNCWFYVADKPELEVAEYGKLISYENVWVQGWFKCPFCSAGLDCKHSDLDLKNCSNWIFPGEFEFQFEL